MSWMATMWWTEHRESFKVVKRTERTAVHVVHVKRRHLFLRSAAKLSISVIQGVALGLFWLVSYTMTKAPVTSGVSGWAALLLDTDEKIMSPV